MTPAASEALGLILAPGGVAVVLIGLLLTRKGAQRAAQQAETPSSTQAYLEVLTARITALELRETERDKRIAEQDRRIYALTADRDGVVAYLRRLYRWARGDRTPPPPQVPERIAPWLDDDWNWPDRLT